MIQRLSAGRVDRAPAPQRLPRPAAPSASEAPMDSASLSAPSPRASALARADLSGPAAAASVPGPAGVQVYLSTVDQRHLLERQADLPWKVSPGAPPRRRIRVDAGTKHQVMEGFGASLTDSSAFLLQQRLSPEKRAEVMERLFGEDGLRLSLLRQPMGSCDYSLDLFSYDDVPGDESLEHFSVDKDRRYILPSLKEAVALNPDLKVIASPWTAPGWMKTSGSLVGGRLKPEHYGTYGEYFAKFVEAYRAEGIDVHAVTPQNEPLYVPNHYPGMGMSAPEQAAFIKEGLGPALERHGLDTKILAYDHNWDRPDYADEVLADPEVQRYVDGVAWHSYGGSHEAMSRVQEAHPDQEMWFTEASGGTWVPAFHDAFMDQMGHVIRAPRNHARSVVWWNVALDKDHGPSLLGDASKCRGLVTVDQATGEVDYNVDATTMGHVSRFVDPGAHRVESNSFRDDLENVAFENPDGSRVLVVSNRTKHRKTFTVEDGDRSFKAALPGEAAATYVWRPEANPPG